MIVDLTSQILAEKENKTLNKPFRTPGGPKKFSVYVKNEKGNVVKVNFGDPNMEIKRDDPDRRRSFRARHNCSESGPKTKARYWSCKMWEAKKSVTDYVKGEWNGSDLFVCSFQSMFLMSFRSNVIRTPLSTFTLKL